MPGLLGSPNRSDSPSPFFHLMSLPKTTRIWVGSGRGTDVVVGPLWVRTSVLLARSSAGTGRTNKNPKSAAMPILVRVDIGSVLSAGRLSASGYARRVSNWVLALVCPCTFYG